MAEGSGLLDDTRDLPDVIADACVKFCAWAGPEYMHRTIAETEQALDRSLPGPGRNALVIMLSKLENLRDRVDPLLSLDELTRREQERAGEPVAP